VENFHPFAVSFATAPTSIKGGQNYAIGPVGAIAETSRIGETALDPTRNVE